MKKFLHAHKKRIQEIGMGLFIYELFNIAYDWFFYPFALVYWGLQVGSIVLVTGSLLQCATMFWLYEKMRIDWLGAHALRELEDKENKNRFEHLAVWIGKEKRTWWEKLLSPVVFVGLTLPIDPLIVAIHYRKKHFGGMTVRDWLVLLAAVIAANAWWLIKIEILVEFAKIIVHQFNLFFSP